MNVMLSSAVTWLHEKWYIAIAVALIVIIGLVYVIIALSKATKSIREDSAVNKARRRDSENERKKQEEMERLKEQDALIADSEEAEYQEGAKEPSAEGQKNQEVSENTQEIAEKNTEENMKKENAKPETAEAEVKDSKAIYRVIYDKENKEWMVKKDGATRVIRRVRTKAEALEIATQFAENQDLALSVQKKDGKFQKKSNYSKMVTAEKEEKKPEEKKAEKKTADKKPATEKKPATKKPASKKG